MYVDVAEDEDGAPVFYVADERGDWIAGPYADRSKAEAKLAGLRGGS